MDFFELDSQQSNSSRMKNDLQGVFSAFERQNVSSNNNNTGVKTLVIERKKSSSVQKKENENTNYLLFSSNNNEEESQDFFSGAFQSTNRGKRQVDLFNDEEVQNDNIFPSELFREEENPRQNQQNPSIQTTKRNSSDIERNLLEMEQMIKIGRPQNPNQGNNMTNNQINQRSHKMINPNQNINPSMNNPQMRQTQTLNRRMEPHRAVIDEMEEEDQEDGFFIKNNPNKNNSGYQISTNNNYRQSNNFTDKNFQPNYSNNNQTNNNYSNIKYSNHYPNNYNHQSNPSSNNSVKGMNLYQTNRNRQQEQGNMCSTNNSNYINNNNNNNYPHQNQNYYNNYPSQNSQTNPSYINEETQVKIEKSIRTNKKVSLEENKISNSTFNENKEVLIDQYFNSYMSIYSELQEKRDKLKNMTNFSKIYERLYVRMEESRRRIPNILEKHLEIYQKRIDEVNTLINIDDETIDEIIEENEKKIEKIREKFKFL